MYCTSFETLLEWQLLKARSNRCNHSYNNRVKLLGALYSHRSARLAPAAVILPTSVCSSITMTAQTELQAATWMKIYTYTECHMVCLHHEVGVSGVAGSVA